MRKIARFSVPVLATVLIVTLLASCSRSKTDDEKLPAGSVSLTGAGSSFDAVLFDRWFTVYHKSHPDVFIKYDSVGSGEGVRRFVGKNVSAEEKIDFGASDSAMSDVELAQTTNDTLMLPVTSACLVLAYNLPKVHGELRLSRKAYAGIFLGENRSGLGRVLWSGVGEAFGVASIGRVEHLLSLLDDLAAMP